MTVLHGVQGHQVEVEDAGEQVSMAREGHTMGS